MDKMDLQRLEFLKELKEREILRKAVRKAIHLVLEKRSLENFQNKFNEVENNANEEILRNMLKDYLHESAATQDNDPAPHRSTGINVLSDLLKKIIPVLEDDYKILTTDDEQRSSFRAHVIHGVKNSLAPLQATDDVGPDSEQALEEDLEEDLGVTVGASDPAEDQFIDIADDAEEEELSPEEEFATGLSGQDLTGRNMAYASFKKIERNILDAYELLSNDEDQELFYDYLITNLKLYFDKFEDELAGNLEEPTTPEYEDAAAEAGDMGGGEEDFEPADDAPEPAPDDVELEDGVFGFSITNGFGMKKRGKGRHKDA